jgi:hypothetical protein
MRTSNLTDPRYKRNHGLFYPMVIYNEYVQRLLLNLNEKYFGPGRPTAFLCLQGDANVDNYNNFFSIYSANNL